MWFGWRDETIFGTLAERTARWRRATEQEAAVYEARYSPAPQNYL